MAVMFLAGCGRVEPPATNPVSIEKSVAVEADQTTFVAAEDWSTFALSDERQIAGWIAMPQPTGSAQYQSSVNPKALGMLPPGECADCHKEIVNQCAMTAHARTSQIATTQSVLGALVPPDNRLETGVPGFFFDTMPLNGQIVHRLTYPDGSTQRTLDVPVAFAVGSGNHGQSYLAWHEDMLCQTPVSFFSEANKWTNSPGTYVDGTADFSRPATARCLDCHNTWFGHAPGTVNRFDQSNWIAGVTCVRCHGPARNHVEFHRRMPAETSPQEIVNPRNLTRERANEVCAQCHSGGGVQRRPAFTYRPGETLADWLTLDMKAEDSSNSDPHSANQLGRLMQSRCFVESNTLTCMDCHNPHQEERGQKALFSRRCLTCHNIDRCGLYDMHGTAISDRCIDCHMPLRRDKDVTSHGSEASYLPLLRDHKIGIWYDATREVERNLK